MYNGRMRGFVHFIKSSPLLDASYTECLAMTVKRDFSLRE